MATVQIDEDELARLQRIETAAIHTHKILDTSLTDDALRGFWSSVVPELFKEWWRPRVREADELLFDAIYLTQIRVTRPGLATELDT